MSQNLRNRILNADDVLTELVVVPEWDAKILVKGMTGEQRVNMYERAKDGDKMNHVRFLTEVVIATACDPDSGEQLFEAADRDMLAGKSGKALERVFDVGARLSGIGADSEDTAMGKSATANTDGS